MAIINKNCHDITEILLKVALNTITLASIINKNCHDITEILLKMALNTKTLAPIISKKKNLIGCSCIISQTFIWWDTFLQLNLYVVKDLLCYCLSKKNIRYFGLFAFVLLGVLKIIDLFKYWDTYSSLEWR